MIGTDEGFWFSLKERPDGSVDYEFFQVNQQLETGSCSDDEAMVRFDALCNAAKRVH